MGKTLHLPTSSHLTATTICLFIVITLSTPCHAIGDPHTLQGVITNNAMGITFIGNYMYLMDRIGVSVQRMINADSAEYVTSLEMGGSQRWPNAGKFRMIVDGNYLYVPYWISGLYILDVSNPASPSIVDSVPTPGRLRSFAKEGDYGYGVSDESGLITFDLTDPTAATIVDVNQEVVLLPFDVVVAMGHVYVADFRLQVYSIEDPSSPQHVHTGFQSSMAVSIRQVDDRLYVIDANGPPSIGLGGLAVFGLADPSVPLLLGSTGNHQSDEDSWITDSVVYVVGTGGLHQVDISDPTQLTASNCSPVGGTPCGPSIGPGSNTMAKYRNFLYVATWTDNVTGYKLFDVFARGDSNNDGHISSADAIWLVNFVFKGGPDPISLAQGDLNCDGTWDASDIIFLVNYIFKSGPVPECP